MRRFTSDERGFTMIAVTISMMVMGLFAVGAWAAAKDDMPAARNDQDRKRAFEAAQAGVEWYAYQLQRDPSYWEKCATLPAITTGDPAPVVLEGQARKWRKLNASQADYGLEILDKRSTTGVRTACSAADPSGTALQDGVLRIRSTGRANGEYRSVIGTFRRTGFVDYIYFTQWETLDPAVSGVSGCNVKRSLRSGSCVTIQFAAGDSIDGPMHTNDESVVTCNSPTFGRPGRADRWEIAGPAPAYIPSCTAGATPVFNGPRVTPAQTMTLPDGNTELEALAGPNWTFSGQTCLTFKGNGTVDVQSATQSGNAINCNGTITNKSLSGASGPPNGVIYIKTTSGTCSYSKNVTYSNSNGCGDVAVKGDYDASLTIGASNDIIVNGDLKRSGDVMMGLIAANFVRVYHPMSGISSSSCGSSVTYPIVHQIDAAILALQHSFQVDNYHCGAPLGTLQINGAIAQYFRGTVGTSSGGTPSTGYIKDYNYDDRLKYRSPPNFLDPIETRWEIIRKSEQAPATKGA